MGVGVCEGGRETKVQLGPTVAHRGGPCFGDQYSDRASAWKLLAEGGEDGGLALTEMDLVCEKAHD